MNEIEKSVSLQRLGDTSFRKGGHSAVPDAHHVYVSGTCKDFFFFFLITRVLPLCYELWGRFSFLDPPPPPPPPRLGVDFLAVVMKDRISLAAFWWSQESGDRKVIEGSSRRK